jgi:hypothetical protein
MAIGEILAVVDQEFADGERRSSPAGRSAPMRLTYEHALDVLEEPQIIQRFRSFRGTMERNR